MICLQEVKKYCQEYYLIENYQEAVNDQTQTWHCHHRHEIDWDLSREELIAIGRYYDVHYSELIFLTHREHNILHNTGENNPMYGKHHTEEVKDKISDSLKGENSPMYGKEGYWKGKEGTFKGKHHTEESKKRISEGITKYHITAEELYDMYVVQGLSMYRIAKIYNCNPETIRFKLKKFNIKKYKKYDERRIYTFTCSDRVES